MPRLGIAHGGCPASARFSELGRPAEALPVTEEAVAIYRELAATSPDRYRLDLADRLLILGLHLSELGRPAEGEVMQREAERIRADYGVS